MKKEKKSAVRKTFDLKPKKPKKPEKDPNVKEGTTSQDILDLIGITPEDVERINKNADAVKKSDKIIKRIAKRSTVKKYKPRKIKGKKPEGFSQWIRSKSELVSELKDKLGTSKITVDNIIKLYAEHNMKVDEPVVLDYDIKDINKYREYDRTRDNGGKLNPEEWDELYADIKKRGIKNHGIIDIRRQSNGNVEVLLGEGNHRLAMAKMLKIKKMPIRFYY